MSAKFDIKSFDAVKKGIEGLKANQDELLKSVVDDIALRVFRSANRLTPVDTGFLRQDWTIGAIEKVGDSYQVEIKNVSPYASFVEHGHRIVSNGTTVGWKEGVFMLTISENAVRKKMDRIIKQRVEGFLGSAFK